AGQVLSSVSGTFLVPNVLQPVWAETGWVRGSLGWPAGPYTCAGDGVCSQAFQHGVIRVPSGGGSPYVVQTGPIAEAYEASGGPSGPWGAQLSLVETFT